MNRRSVILLLAGAVLVDVVFLRYGVGEFGWIAFAPFLIFAHERRPMREHVALLLVLIAAWIVALAKIVTAEIPWTPVPVFAAPMAVSSFLSLELAGLAHRRLGPRWGVYAFASMMAAIGWIQYSFTELSSWGVLAHTQVENFPLVQLASLTGLGGVTFLVALGSGLSAAAWSSGTRAVRTDVAVFAVLLGSALLYGQVRLAQPAPGTPIRAGAVVSPITHDHFRAAYEDINTLRRFDDELFARSERAAAAGAKIVVWNEGATFVNSAGEPALVARARDFAIGRGVVLLMAYGVVETVHPFHYANKYRIYLADGTMADEYVKRHPVPGDPNDKGTAHARVIPWGATTLTGAICYDYGFPAIARDNATDGASLALVPSSDWRGIDPEHGRMAAMNAVAVGLPMVRPVRAATSLITDQFGRTLGSMRADGGNDGVLVAAVPDVRVPTLYARTGEVVPVLALAFGVVCLVRVWRRGRS